MNLRIAYYVFALAISRAAVTGAYNYAATNANATAAAGATAASKRHGLKDGWLEIARAADAANATATTAALTAYAIAGAVSLAAFSGAYILDKRRGIAEMVGRCSRAYLDFNKHVK